MAEDKSHKPNQMSRPSTTRPRPATDVTALVHTWGGRQPTTLSTSARPEPKPAAKTPRRPPVSGGPVKLLLLADTHVPRRARDLPAQVWDEVARADVVVHAGDWVVPELLDELAARSARLVACWGNNDGPELRSRLPERADVGAGRAAVHRGPRDRRQRRTRRPDVAPLPRHRRAGVRPQPHPVGHHDQHRAAAAEPGLADRSPAPAVLHLYDRRRIDDGALTDVVLHRLEK